MSKRVKLEKDYKVGICISKLLTLAHVGGAEGYCNQFVCVCLCFTKHWDFN